MLCGVTQVFSLNGISFCPTDLAGCTGVIGGQTDRQTDHASAASVAVGGVDDAFIDAGGVRILRR